jgi:hypothetical protein
MIKTKTFRILIFGHLNLFRVSNFGFRIFSFQVAGSNGARDRVHVPPEQAPTSMGQVTALDMCRPPQPGIKAENLPATPPAMISRI